MKYPLRTDFEDEDFHLAHAGPFVLMNWRGRYHSENFARIEKTHLRLAERRKTEVTGISVVEEDSPVPGGDIRIAGADMMTRTGDTTKAVVIIFLDQGFAASALQSVAARELSLGGRVPMKFFREIPAAAHWLAELYPKLELTAEDVMQMIDKLRVRFSPSRLPGPLGEADPLSRGPSSNPGAPSSNPNAPSSNPRAPSSSPRAPSSNPKARLDDRSSLLPRNAEHKPPAAPKTRNTRQRRRGPPPTGSS